MSPPFLSRARNTAALYSRMAAFAAGSGGLCTVLEDSGFTSARGQPLRYLRIRSTASGARQAVLIVGGMHAREWAPPDALLQFAEYLVGAYRTGSALDLPAIRGSRYTTSGAGGAPGPDAIFDLPAHRISSNEVQRVMDKLDIFIAPVVNPDGRDYTMAPAAGPFAGNMRPIHWRKNDPPADGTDPNPPPSRGANINGNFPVPRVSGAPTPASMRESLERYYGPAAGLGTGTINWSDDSADWDVYGGPTEASEAETKFVQWLVETKSIRFYMDVHSAAHIISYPWAMEKNGTDASQKFAETGWDSTSGPPHTAPAGHPGGRDGTAGDVYNEYLPLDLLHQHVTVAGSIRNAILTAAGADPAARERSSYNDMRSYGVPNFGGTGPGPIMGSIAELLYAAPASGMDWVFSRQFTNPALAPVYGFAFECGDLEEGHFWPLYGDPSVPSDPTVPATNSAAGHQFPKIEREVVIGVMELLKFAAAWRPPSASRCYVATAVYGSSLHPAVQFVVQLRERELRKTRAGRRFLAAVEWIYEPIGPRVARVLVRRARLRGIARRGLVEPLIGAIRRCERATHRMQPRERRVTAFVAMLTSILLASVAGGIALVVLVIWWLAHG